jgi:hypothetical protein
MNWLNGLVGLKICHQRDQLFTYVVSDLAQNGHALLIVVDTDS